MKNGVFTALLGYILWGFTPIFWKLIQEVPPIEILFHRIVWSLVFLVILLALKKQWKWLKESKNNPKVLLSSLLCGLILSVNWYTYIWAVNEGFLLESSLGYYINPLVNILLGMIFLKERLRYGQWFALGIAFLGVSYLTYSYGELPWIALTLAFTFGFYGLLKKTGGLSAIEGLTVETLVLVLPSIVFLIYFEINGASSFGHISIDIDFYLIMTGIATSIPLLLFAHGAKRVTMTTLGLLQYTAPTIQFFLGIYLYNESFNSARVIGFGAIWTALFIFSIEGIIWKKHIKQKMA